MNNSFCEFEKNEKHEDDFFPKTTLFTPQFNEKENDSLDNNDLLERDTITFDKFLEIRTKANSNDGNFFKRKNLNEKSLLLSLEQNNYTYPNYIIENPFYNENGSNKKQCGRKRKRPIDNKIHNKFSDDNMRRRCKHLVLKNILFFINKQIRIQYKGDIGNGILKKELHIINQSQKSDATINFNKDFLNKKLKDIFSESISARYTSYPSNQNKIIIDRLLNENDEKIRQYFTKLFNFNFLECLGHFRGKTIIKELEGLKCFKDIKNEILNQYKDGKEYVDKLEKYLNNYEEITLNKKPRRSWKSKIK